MQNTEHGQVVDLIPAYALNSLDSAEAEFVDRHLADCASCREELTAYQAVVDMLPLAVPDAEPSPQLKDRLMAKAKETPAASVVQGEASVSARDREPLQPRLVAVIQNLLKGPRWQPVALLFVIALVVSNIWLWRQVTGSGSGSSSWRRVTLTGSEAAPEARGIIYISSDGRHGTLVVDGLPQLSQEQQYQLWLIQDGQRASGAVFSVNEDGYRGLQIEAAQPLREFEAFGVTVEPAGGSPGPTGERVLEHNL